LQASGKRLREWLRRMRARWAPGDYGPLEAIPMSLYRHRYRFRADLKGYTGEAGAREAVDAASGHTLISYERAVTLFQQVVHLEARGIEGALVECGVWKGGAAAVMAQANLRHGSRRRMIHLFDSFAGLPEPTPKDGERVMAAAAMKAERPLGEGGALRPVNWDVAGREDCEALMRRIGFPAEWVRYHVGWFQDTLSSADGIGPIALLRIDVDWYESTRLCLEKLFPHVVPGGFVVFDDYGHFEGCRKAVDEFLARHAIGAFLHHIDYTGRYLVKCGG
jgi:O-methyltransferase